MINTSFPRLPGTNFLIPVQLGLARSPLFRWLGFFVQFFVSGTLPGLSLPCAIERKSSSLLDEPSLLYSACLQAVFCVCVCGVSLLFVGSCYGECFPWCVVKGFFTSNIRRRRALFLVEHIVSHVVLCGFQFVCSPCLQFWVGLLGNCWSCFCPYEFVCF